MTFITRFAPSPTGPLHLGHAYSAILAHDMARAAGGRFLLRMEDTDLARSKPEWDNLIRRDLSWLGLQWDGPVLSQSPRIPLYNDRLETLVARGLLYPCSCSRKDIRAALSAPQEGSPHQVYPGTCRGRPMSSRRPDDALRLDLDAALAALSLKYKDQGAGDGPDQALASALAFRETGPIDPGLHPLDAARARSEIGDIVLSRKGEAIVAYFLASAFDDADQQITHVIRGHDLFDFTPIQLILQSLFDLPTPLYHHHRLIRDDAGKRLAKRDDARAISTYRDQGASPADIRAMVGL